jgi:hypothetical protein
MEVQLGMNHIICMIVVILAIFYLYNERLRLTDENARLKRIIDEKEPDTSSKTETMKSKPTKRTYDPVDVNMD